MIKEQSGRLPEVDMTALFSDNETLLNPPSWGSPKNLRRVEQQQYQFLFDFSYELDLWGKLKAREDQAHYLYQASNWEYEFVYQTIVTEVASLYLSLRTLEQEIQFLERSINIWEDTICINESRTEAGLDTEINLSRAKLEHALAEACLDHLRKKYAILENTLATILGKPASCWSLPQGEFPLCIPEIPEVLPSELLMRRPDIQQRGALVSAGRSEVDVALRDFFPSFSLTTSLGLASPFLGHFLKWQARYWNYAFFAIGSLFDGGRKEANVLKAKANFFQNFINYQKTVNQAFQDVEDALSTFRYTQLQYEAQGRAQDAAFDTFSLAKDQYETGLISYLLVADSEKTALETAKKKIILKGEAMLSWIRIIKALGIQRE